MTRVLSRRGSWLVLLALAAGACASGGVPGDEVVLVFPGSAVGAEAEVLDAQLERFMAAQPGIRVVRRPTPDAADERHQLYVQWLGAGASEPDVLQLDVIWTAEFAAAGWILPLDGFGPAVDDLFPAVLEAARWSDALYAMPWFVDVGLLYYRTDLVAEPPATLEALARAAHRARRDEGLPYGLVLQGARYEGLVTTFLELVGAHGGDIVDASGAVTVDSDAGLAALEWLVAAVDGGLVPEAALTWREEPARFAFQNGRAAFMRNWPYAGALMRQPGAEVAGRFSVAPLPAGPGGASTSALGGSLLAVSARSRHPEAAWALVEYLTRPAQMLERARVVGQLPPRAPLYEDPRLERALDLPMAPVREALLSARPRPVTPAYTALSQVLQVELHRALTGQDTPRAALSRAAAGMRRVLDLARPPEAGGRPPARTGTWLALLAGLALLAAALAAGRRLRRWARDRETRVAWAFVAPALGVIAAVAVFPLAWTVWESLHLHDLRMPWLGRRFVGLGNYAEAFGEPRFWEALLHTGLFTAGAVSLELVLGVVFALALDRAFRGRGLMRALVLVPWAVPTVVAAMLWRFMFEGRAGIANAVLLGVGLLDAPVVWFGRAALAWVPIVLGDVWKTTPFVTLLLLAGLQGIDAHLYEAARVDGAGAWGRFRHVTLPLLKPAILIALLFRTLDAFRVFDLVYVLTGGGPGTSTEPIALYTWTALLQHLRFGYGSALSVIVFLVTFALAVVYVRLLGRAPT